MNSLKFMWAALAIFCGFIVQAQNRMLNGRVISSKSGEALQGITLNIPSLKRSFTSKQDGSFSMSVPAGAFTLVATSSGYLRNEINVGADESDITIRLQENISNLDEIVVTGYSERRRGELTTATQVVSEKMLKDVTANNIGTMLQGKVAGLQVVNSSGVPGATPEIRLRGLSSINASQSPLYVVDGIIGGNYDPNDVESVTILKDAGATAIYGSQANGGVIIITTKKGKAGKTRYEAKLTTGFRRPDFGELKMMNGQQLWEYQKELYRDYIPADSGNSHKVDILKFYGERPLSLKDADNNWLTTIFKPAMMQNYFVSASGRTDKLDYYFGVSYYDEKGTFMNTKFKRLNLRGNTTLRISDKVSLTNNINLSGAMGTGYDYNDVYYAYLNLPWDNPYDSLGRAKYVDGNSPFRWWSRDKINPVHTIQNSDHPYKGYDANYDMTLNAAVTKWLSLTSSNRVSASYNKSNNYFSPLVASTYHDQGYLDENSSISYGYITNNLARLNFNWGDHHLSGLAGMAYETGRTELSGASGRGLPIGVVSLSVLTSGVLVTGSTTETSIFSLLSQANYNFRNKYFLSASFRRDESSNFPVNNRWASFPSVSAAWQVSNEDFFNVSVIDNFKLRASYGATGTQDIGALRYLGLYSLSSQYNNNPAATPLQIPNANLTWESKEQVNLGADISFGKRVALTVDVYRNITKDLLIQVSQPLSVGFETRWENTGEIENKGIEVGINSVNIRQGRFEWSTDFNVNFNSNTVRKLPSDIVKTGSWAISQIYRNGGNLYEFYMPVYAGVNAQTGAPQWEKLTTDAQGNITKKELTSEYSEATYQEAGSALPKFQGGLNNRFQFDNFFLNVNAYFLSGNKVFSNNLRFVVNDGSEPYLNQAVLPDNYSIWTKPGDIATNPSPQNNSNSTETSTRYLMDGKYISIRNITLGYSLPNALVKRWGMEDLSLSVSADNVHTFTDFFGQDPQTTITPGSFVTPGVSDFKYPNNRQFLFNINVKF